MKKFSIIYLILFCLIQDLYCQNIIPDWFLNPNKNEYVGVSGQYGTDFERECNATNLAIISYILTDYPDFVIKESTSKNENFNSSTTRKIKYTITQKHINKNGEVFISIKVLPYTNDIQKSIAEVSIVHSTTDNNNFLLTENKILLFNQKSNEFKSSYKINNTILIINDIKYETTNIELTTSNLRTQEYSQNENSLNFPKSNQNHHFSYPDSDGNGSKKIYISCGNSLHDAYLQYLLTLANDNKTRSHKLSLINNFLTIEFLN